MKSIWKYLVNHIWKDYNTKAYISIIVFIAIAIFINYKFSFHRSFLGSKSGLPKFGYYFLFYSVAYYLALLIISLCKKEAAFFRQRIFWIKSLLAVFTLSLDSSVPFLRESISKWFDPQLHYWVYKVGVNLISFFTILLPLFIFYWIFDRRDKYFYGLNAKAFDSRPYFQMLLIMLPVLVAASFHPTFVKQYPMYRSSGAHIFMQVPEWNTVLGYELAYGLDFVTVEFLFRGFMVIGMSAVLGRNSVLAMAVAYCFLHFGKPPGEAISSVFGGYILGVVAFETKSIWGGVIVHVGIAWMMEVIAFSHKYF